MRNKTWQQERKDEERAAREANKRSGRVQTPDGPGLVLARAKVKNTNGGPGSNKYRVRDCSLKATQTHLKVRRNSS